MTDQINKNVLVNLSGPDSIIGRGLGIYERRDSKASATAALVAGTETIKNCCIIAVDRPPTALKEDHHHHGYGTPGHSHTSSYAGHTHSGYASPTYGYTYPGGATTSSSYHTHGVVGGAMHSTGIAAPGTSSTLYSPYGAHGHYRAY